MQVTLLQAKLQLGKAMVETDKSYVGRVRSRFRDFLVSATLQPTGSKKTATTSDFLHGVHELERRIASLESRLDNLATTSTPWLLAWPYMLKLKTELDPPRSSTSQSQTLCDPMSFRQVQIRSSKIQSILFSSVGVFCPYHIILCTVVQWGQRGWK